MVLAPETANTLSKPWAPIPGENNLWYDRFHSYMMLGPGRSIEETYRVRKTLEPKLTGDRPTGAWHARAHALNWEERANAYDQSIRDAQIVDEEQRRINARERRRTMLTELAEATYKAILNANLREIGQDEARGRLNTLRSMFADLVTALRLEMGLPTAIQQNQELTFTADDLAEAQRQLGDAWPANHFGFAAKTTQRQLLLLVAPRSVDMVKLTASTLDFTDIDPKDRSDLAGAVGMARQGVTDFYLHIGLGTTPEWLFLEHDTVDPAWCEGHVTGAKVLLLEAHAGAAGPWERLAEYVVTLDASLPAGEARQFTTTFWSLIADGRPIEEAYAQAANTCSEQERGKASKHW